MPRGLLFSGLGLPLQDQFWPSTLEISTILKTVRKSAILIKFWALWVLETYNIVPLKNLYFLNSGHH